ncbi:MAG: hypothetical protein RIC89_04910 [Pseudomonadales bacterium]
MLLAIDPDKDFIDKEGITVATVLPFQPAGENSSKFDTPQAD